MRLSEADARAKLIDPELPARGWTEDLIRREETAGTIEIVDGRARKRAKGRVDYVLLRRELATAQTIHAAAETEHAAINALPAVLLRRAFWDEL